MIKVAEFHHQVCEGLYPTMHALKAMGAPKIVVETNDKTCVVYVDLTEAAWAAIVAEQESLIGHFHWEDCGFCTERFESDFGR